MVIALLILFLLSDIAAIYLVIKFKKIIKNQSDDFDELLKVVKQYHQKNVSHEQSTDVKLEKFEKATSQFVQGQVNKLEKKIYKEFDIRKTQQKHY